MDYKYIEQLLDKYFEAQTTLEEEQILRAFFAQEDVPAHLLPYREFFTYQSFGKNAESLGSDFDEKMLSIIGKEKSDEPHHVVARKVSLNKRLRPLYKAAACVAIVLSIGQAAQMPYYKSEAEQQESLARSLEQLQQIQKDKNAVAQGDSLIKIEKLKIENWKLRLQLATLDFAQIIIFNSQLSILNSIQFSLL